MTVPAAALFGALGAILHDAFELGEVILARRRDVPSEFRTAAFALASVLRILAGAAIAALVAAVEDVGPLGATLIGGLGPLVLQRVADLVFDTGQGRS